LFHELLFSESSLGWLSVVLRRGSQTDLHRKY
jgi:hypothetical protein